MKTQQYSHTRKLIAIHLAVIASEFERQAGERKQTEAQNHTSQYCHCLLEKKKSTISHCGYFSIIIVISEQQEGNFTFWKKLTIMESSFFPLPPLSAYVFVFITACLPLEYYCTDFCLFVQQINEFFILA